MSTNEPPDNVNANDDDSPERLAADAAELRRQLDEIGFQRPRFMDESLAPEVDSDVLRALVRRELPPKSAKLVYRLIYSFKSWRDAHCKMLVAEYEQGRASNPEAE